MTHLTDADLVDALDGRLPTERSRHLDACAACREQVASLGAVLRAARADEVPEPSPLFWEQLSARVSRAVRVPPSAWDWARVFGLEHWRLAAATIVLVIAAGVSWQVFVSRDRAGRIPAPRVEQTLGGSHVPPDEGFADAWDAIEMMAVDLDWEGAQTVGLGSRPGSAEPLVSDMSPAERAELARIIAEEIKRTGA